MIIYEITIALATLLTGLIAGFFFAYTYSVNIGLGKLDDLTYLSAMQKINRAILNPIFYLCFIGPLLLLPLATILQYQQNNFRFISLFIASSLYIGGVFLLTGLKNVPLNNRLDQVDLAKTTNAQNLTLRQEFEKTWNFWHNIRTYAAIVTLVILIFVCIG